MLALLTEMSNQQSRELRGYAARRRLARSSRSRRGSPAVESGSDPEQISIRRLDRDGADREALLRLAGRDSASIPDGDLLGAELGRRLVAAISLSNGELVADPFTPTAGARTLLVLRAAQLGGAGSNLGRARAHHRGGRHDRVGAHPSA